MNKKILLASTAVAILVSACTGGSVKKAKITTTQDSVSYIVGHDYGSGIVKQMATFPEGMNNDEFLNAFISGFNGEEPKIEVENRRMYIMNYVQEARKDTTGTFVTQEKKDSISYVLGADYGSGILEQIQTFPGGINNEAFLDAFVTGFKGDSSRIAVDSPRDFVMEYIQEAQKIEAEKKAAEDAETAKTDSVAIAGKKFLDENAKKDGVVTTESGLQYKVIKQGTGEKPTAQSRVKVLYKGTTVDGNVFDSALDKEKPAMFGVGQVIKGWTEGLQLMPVGSKYELYIPYNLAYGSQSPSKDIPAFSTLVFEVELLEIVK